MSKNVALVLSTGGARGFGHIGVINELMKRGYNITSVAGCSMGALVGGMLATGQIKDFENWICSLDKMEIIRLTDISISKKGLVKGKKIMQKMKEIVPDRNIEDLEIPYCAVAVDILNDTETVFTKGDLYDAIRASISIPTVFQPFQIDDSFYVDGGVLNPIPINHVKRNAEDIVVVVNANARPTHLNHNSHSNTQLLNPQSQLTKAASPKEKNEISKEIKAELGIYNLTNRSISLMLNKISELTLVAYKPDVLVDISHASFGTYEFSRAAEIIAEGQRKAVLALNSFENK